MDFLSKFNGEGFVIPYATKLSKSIHYVRYIGPSEDTLELSDDQVFPMYISLKTRTTLKVSYRDFTISIGSATSSTLYEVDLISNGIIAAQSIPTLYSSASAGLEKVSLGLVSSPDEAREFNDWIGNTYTNPEPFDIIHYPAIVFSYAGYTRGYFALVKDSKVLMPVGEEITLLGLRISFERYRIIKTNHKYLLSLYDLWGVSDIIGEYVLCFGSSDGLTTNIIFSITGDGLLLKGTSNPCVQLNKPLNLIV